MPATATGRCERQNTARYTQAMSASNPSILVMHDGGAGNRRQALALAQAWDLPYGEHVLSPHSPWRWAAPRMLPASSLAFGKGFREHCAQPPAVAVGCGRQAALATRLLRQSGSHVVQILHPRMSTTHWDTVVLPAHDGVSAKNVLCLDGSLNPIDDAWLQRARDAHPKLGEGEGPRTVLMLGGPTADSDWDSRALATVMSLLLGWQERDGGRLQVIASRRTPTSLRRHLRHRLAGRALFWGDESDGPNPYEGALAWADQIVVTPDSANLISEAAATRAPMWIALPRWNRGRLRHLITHAIDSGRARPLGPEAGRWDITPWRESARVAAALKPYVLERLGSAVADAAPVGSTAKACSNSGDASAS